MLHIHQHVIHLIINVIESLQVCLITFIIGIAGQIHPHCLKIQIRARQVRFGPEFVGAGVQSVRSNQIGVQIHPCIAMDGVKRQVQCSERERSIPDVQTTGVVEVPSYVRQHVRGQGAGANIQSHRIEHEAHVAQLTVRYVEGHRSGGGVLVYFLLGFAQLNTYKSIRQHQSVQRVLPFRDVESRTLYI